MNLHHRQSKTSRILVDLGGPGPHLHRRVQILDREDPCLVRDRSSRDMSEITVSREVVEEIL